MNFKERKEILAALKADLKAAEPLKQNIDAKIATWRSEYEGKPYGNEVKGKSSIISRDIKKQSEWQHANIIDPFVNGHDIIKAHPITYEDAEAAKQNELLLNTQFCRKFDRYNFMSKAIKVLDIEGTLIVQTGWDYEDEEIEQEVETIALDEAGNPYITTEVTTVTRVIKNQPTARVCRNEDIYIDPTCQDNIDNAQFFIHRYEVDLSTLRKDGRYNEKALLKVAKNTVDVDVDYESPDETYFQFQDDARKKHIVYEYWGNYDINGDGIAEAIVCAWIGNVIIRLEDNPYPDKKPPFLVVPFNSIPFRMHGEANAELIGDNQKVKTAILRGLIDNMAQSNNGQVGLRKGALDQVNKSRFLSGKNFEYNGTPNDFWQGSYNQIPGSVLDMVGLMNNEIESLTGVKGFSAGITGASLGPSATAARGALDATAVRRMNIVRNISENLIKPLMRKWMAYNAEFLEDEEVIRITNNEFVPVRKDDLDGRIDIDITVTTAEDNAAKAQELSFLLQTLGPSEDPNVRRGIMADIMELMRMPDRAKALREYQPEPDPMVEQMKQIEMQKLMNEAKAAEALAALNLAKAKEAEYEMMLKQARAKAELARARKLDSEADAADLKFLADDEGIEYQRSLEKERREYEQELRVLAYQAELGDDRLGVRR